jgi:hypothetical protein
VSAAPNPRWELAKLLAKCVLIIAFAPVIMLWRAAIAAAD